MRTFIIALCVAYLAVGSAIYVQDVAARRSIHICPSGSQPISALCPQQTVRIMNELPTALIVTVAWPALVLGKTGVGIEIARLHQYFSPSTEIHPLPNQ